MQNTIFEPENLPQLANPSAFDQLVFESSTTSAIIVAAAAIVIAVILARSAKMKPAIIVTIAGLLVATGIFIAGAMVKTPREDIADRLVELVDATASADAPALQRLLDESVRVQTRFGSADSRDRVIALATSRAAPAVDSVRAVETRVGLSGPRIARSLVKVRAQGDTPMGTSWWIVDWSRPNEHTDQWVATHIEPFWIQGVNDPAGP